MKNEQLVIVYHNEAIYSFERSDKWSPSVFGGPLEVHLSGIEHGPRPLHHIARLAMHDFSIEGPENYISELPLIYGLCYDGCRVRYRKNSGSNVKLIELVPTQSSDDFPYRDYPVLLPFVPLRLSRAKRGSYSDFANRFSNMPEEQPSDLVVAVPAPATLGVSLWGRHGDPEDVTIVFECDLRTKMITAYNVCS